MDAIPIPHTPAALDDSFVDSAMLSARCQDANAEYPDKALPTMVVYKNGDVLDRVVSMKTNGGLFALPSSSYHLPTNRVAPFHTYVGWI